MQTVETSDAGGTRQRRSLRRAEDLDLVEIVRDGDTEAFGVLFERHWPAMRTVAARYCDNHADADDITVTAFMHTLRSITRGHGPTSSLRSYLVATTVRVAGDRHRRRRYREVPLDQAPEQFDETEPALHEPALRDAAIHETADSDLTRAFAQLPARWQHVLWECCVVGRPVKEIAVTMGVSANTAAAIAYRARLGLRDAYLAAGAGPQPGPKITRTEPQ